MSFFGLAVTWTDWNREWHDVERISGKTVWSIIVLLFFMSFVPYTTGLIASDPSNPVGLILYGAIVTGFTLANCIAYRSVGQIEENAAIKDELLKRSRLLAVNAAIMAVFTLMSIFAWAYFSIIGVVEISILFALPICRTRKGKGEDA